MGKKKKNKPAKQSTKTASPVAQNGNPNSVDTVQSNPDNYITIEIPDTPENISAINQSTSNINKTTDVKPSEKLSDNTTLSYAGDNANTTKDNSQNKDTPAKKAEKTEKIPLTQEQLDAKNKHNKVMLSKTADVAIAVILAIVGLLILLPILFAVMQSVKPLSALREVPQSFFPKSFSLQTFTALFSADGESGISSLRFLFNTLIIAIVVTTLRIVVTTGAAYILAKVRAPMLKTINGIINLSLVLTPALAYTMNYVLLVKTGLADTIFALILPYIASPLCLVLLRESIKRIPDETILAAKLEGCSHTSILRKIVLPQSKPAITAVIILTLFEMGKVTGGVATFSEKLDTLCAFTETLYNRVAVGELYALVTLMLIPVVTLLIVFRKSLLETMTTAMLKEEK